MLVLPHWGSQINVVQNRLGFSQGYGKDMCLKTHNQYHSPGLSLLYVYIFNNIYILDIYT